MIEYERVTTKHLHCGDVIVVEGPNGRDPRTRSYVGCRTGAIVEIGGHPTWKHIVTTSRTLQCGSASKVVRLVNLGRGSLGSNGDLLDEIKRENGIAEETA